MPSFQYVSEVHRPDEWWVTIIVSNEAPLTEHSDAIRKELSGLPDGTMGRIVRRRGPQSKWEPHRWYIVERGTVRRDLEKERE